ncbi:hypothetical protein PG999_014568 [Apiospora kogelbergensis]|uniref:Uncharacterized protein n=1 Tax=Apiospora kogelbergensis TaxID=1337665 RepID=A0AAW0Q5B5_9PEZI
MHVSKAFAVFGLYISSGALAALIAPPMQPRATAAAAEVMAARAAAPAPAPAPTQVPVDEDPSCKPDPFCDPAWPEGSVSVVTDTAAGACTPVLSTRFHSHVCGRTTWTTSVTTTSTAACGACAIGTLAPLSFTYYVPHCPLGGHHTVSTAKVASTRTEWACAATAA